MSEKKVEDFVGLGRRGDLWQRWVKEISFTWALVILFVIAPAVIFGASAQSMMVLLASVVFGLPTALAAFLLIKDRAWRNRLCRRLVVIGGVSTVSLIVVLQTDKMTPSMATPIARAIDHPAASG